MIWLCVTPNRKDKTGRLMEALHKGSPDNTRLIEGPPPNDGNPFVVWGQLWTALEIIPHALRTGRPFWHIDNGYYRSAGGRPSGYYRITYNGMTPAYFDIHHTRLQVDFTPWRQSGHHIVLAMPGEHFGKAIGANVARWRNTIRKRIEANTDRRILVRNKGPGNRMLSHDLKHAWALVTHSSTAAVEAVRLGIPVFVHELSAAIPVGNLDLADLEDPIMPTRHRWWQSLMWQQFTLQEMAAGIAWPIMMRQKAFAEKAERAVDSNV